MPFNIIHADITTLKVDAIVNAQIMTDNAPGRIIFAYSCFYNTEQQSNVRLTLKDKGINIKTL